MRCEKKQIRDIVYEYVFFTSIEELVIEHALFQRLRFVFQNSCAYLTYPANQLTRFSHSLGVMHIGGNMFKHAITNSSEEGFDVFIQHSRSVIIQIVFQGDEEEYTSFVDLWAESIGNIGEFTKCTITDFSDNEVEFILNYTWQSLRIACLIHDIGHFPFSHIFEMGIDNFEKRNTDRKDNPVASFKQQLATGLNISASTIEKAGATKLHEFFGAYILKVLPDELTDTANPYIPHFNLCLKYAETIFLVENPDESSQSYNYEKEDPSQVMVALHTIVSSDIDADRLDYVLRDAQSSGINLGNFDFERIVMNGRFVKTIRSEKPFFRFYIDDKALSSIEQFFNHRYLLYQHLYFHHNVSKYDGILIEALSTIIELAVVKQNKIVIDILEYHRFFHEDGFLSLKNIENYDDCWLRTFFQDIYRRSADIKNERLHLLLDTFLYRRSENTFSFIKKSSDIESFLLEFLGSDPDLPLKISTLKTTYIAALLSELAYLPDQQLLGYLFAKYFINKGSVRQQFLTAVQAAVESNFGAGVIIIHKDTPPKLLDPKTMMLKGENLIPIKSLSLYLSGFSQISRFYFQHYFGIVAKGVKDNEDIKLKCKSILFHALKDTFVHAYEKEMSLANEKIKLINKPYD